MITVYFSCIYLISTPLFCQISSGDTVFLIMCGSIAGGGINLIYGFILACYMCPLVVASDVLRCFLTIAGMSPGQVE